MCGICGIFDVKKRVFIQKEQLLSMRDMMVHRGPDDAGVFSCPEDGIYLGHRRLKIIDLSVNGRQPMSNEDSTIQIVCNGEIYNFPKLRRSLEEKGHLFKSNSDTEVLIHLYEEKGLDLLDDLEGMFAFAIWDKRKETLFLARDRIGIKPLYFYYHNDLFLFASEIKSISAFGEIVDRTINYNAIHSFFQYSYIPYPMTIYKNIQKLEPGHFIKINRKEIIKKQYWDINPGASVLNETEAIERNRDLVLESVKSHLISDAPLGAFLSGGIDSTIIVSTMSKTLHAPVSTFTIGFERATNTKDIILSRIVSDTFGTDHHEYIMTPDISNLFEEIIWHLDEPFSVTSAIPIYLNSKFAKKKVDVVLTGDGADEVYAGYSRYGLDKILLTMQMIPEALRKVLLKSIIRMIGSFSLTSKMGKGRDLILKRMLTATDQKNPLDAYLSLFPYAKSAYLNAILNEEFFKEVDQESNYQSHISRYYGVKNMDHLANLLYFDIKTSLVDEMLTKVDRMTMAHGLEARVPFLNHKLIEFIFSLKDFLKLKGMRNKYILKKSFGGYIPQEILHAPKKGFNVPIDQWLRHELRETFEELVTQKKLDETGIFRSAKIEEMKEKHLECKGNFGTELWGLMVFIKWFDLHG